MSLYDLLLLLVGSSNYVDFIVHSFPLSSIAYADTLIFFLVDRMNKHQINEEEKRKEKKKCYLDKNLTYTHKKKGTLSSLSMSVLAHIYSKMKTTKNLVSYYVVV